MAIKIERATIQKENILSDSFKLFREKGYSIDAELLGSNFFEAAGIDFNTGITLQEKLEKRGHLDEVIKNCRKRQSMSMEEFYEY